MLAEARMVVDDTEANPKAIILSASSHRELTNAAELPVPNDCLAMLAKLSMRWLWM